MTDQLRQKIIDDIADLEKELANALPGEEGYIHGKIDYARALLMMD